MQLMLIGIKLLFWMVMIPFGCGIPLAAGFGLRGRSFEMTWVSGYLVMVSLFQIYYIFFILFYNHFTPLVWLTGISYVAIAVFAWIRYGKYHVGGRKAGRYRKTKIEIVGWAVFAILLLFQVYMTLFYYYPDGDDAFYAVTSVITTTNDTMYINIPYTGETSVLDKRHAFSSAPIFISFLAKVCGVHPVVMSNVFFSIVIIILTYMIYKLIAAELLADKVETIPLFMIIMSILTLYGNSTIYQASTFLLTRTGQGKAFLANLVPAVTLLALLYIDKNEKANQPDAKMTPWVVLSCSMLTAGYTSTMGMFLGPFLAGGGSLLLAFRHKKNTIVRNFAIAALPLLILSILYLLLIYLPQGFDF